MKRDTRLPLKDNLMRLLIPALLVLLVTSCGAPDSAGESEQPSQRSRDSAVANSNLPGASGVSGAMAVADSAAARRAREDSIVKELQR